MTNLTLDADTPDTIRLSVSAATELGSRALGRLGFPDDDGRIIIAQLIDNALCGYPFASLPRILAMAQNDKVKQPRTPVLTRSKKKHKKNVGVGRTHLFCSSPSLSEPRGLTPKTR